MNKGIFYFWHDRTLFIGKSVDTTLHSHYALQIAIGFNRPFRLYLENKSFFQKSVMIAPGYPHRLDGADDLQAVLLLDPESSLAARLQQKYLEKGNVNELGTTFDKSVLYSLNDFGTERHSCGDAKKLCDTILMSLLDTLPPLLPSFNPKIREILEFISSLPAKKTSVSRISKEVHLSESRIIHLFKDEMGLPIRRYLLWLRLIEAVKMVFSGFSLTEAAHESGFSDSAHLSRTFKNTFGMTPSELFKNSRFVQAISCIE